MIGKVISHFKIVEKLGKGGMGIVYKAHDQKLDRAVALKFISSDYTPTENEKDRFLQEAKAAAKLNHPNICSIHSIDNYEGQPFIEMEYIEGETLRERLRSPSQMPLDTYRKYAAQLTDALAAAHQKGIIHRDIKPENIMVDNHGKIKIMDFGLAKLKGMPSYTNAGSTLGTLTYMSPEQIKGDLLDERSDLFSLGIIFYEMLTGLHPFSAEYQQALIFKILNEDPEALSTYRNDLPVALENIINRCLQKDPQSRYHSADDLKLELRGEKKGPILKKNQKQSLTSWRQLPISLNRFATKNFSSIISVGTLILLMVIFWIQPFSIPGTAEETIPGERHIAVLPFNNLNPRDIPPSLNNGILEILTSHITQLEMHERGLWVIPSSEIRAGNITSVKEANQLLGANLAVTGSLQHIGDQLLLTINLVDGTTMRQLRSSTLEMDWSNQMELQDEVVQNLTSMLEIELEPEAVQSITAGGTLASQAYQHYIEGQGYLSRYDESNIDRAIDIFHKSINADSGFVRAYAALAETYWRKYELTHDTQWAEHAIKFGNQAIGLMAQPIPDVYITLALINNGMERYQKALGMLNYLSEYEKLSYRAIIEQAKAYEGLEQPVKAEKSYHQAIERKKNYWDGYYSLGLFYSNHGRLKEAAEAFEEVTKLAPTNARAFTSLGAIYQYLGETQKAIETLHRSLEVNPTYQALTNLGTIYFYQRDYEAASRIYEQALELNDTDRRIWGNLGYAYHWINKDSTIVTTAMRKAIELTEQELEVTPNNQELLQELAGYYLAVGNVNKCRTYIRQLTSKKNIQQDTRIALIPLFERLGDRDSALHWMERSLKEGDDIAILTSLKEMDNFWADARVKQLQKEYIKEKIK